MNGYANPMRAVGLMSGTSRDGIDAAILATDGEAALAPGPALTAPYPDDFRARLAEAVGAARAGRLPPDGLEAELTDLHADAVERLLALAGLEAGDVDLVGFHGHTMVHRPEAGRTWQLGDGARLADMLGIDVVCDFRAADMAAGGEGAPLAPVYHRARLAPRAGGEALAVLNLGGVANVTWIAPGGEEMMAFDTGPGNALLDDWVRARTGEAFDAGGALAARGKVDVGVLQTLLAHPYFDRPPPKSLDRDAFPLDPVAMLADADGAATLAAFTVEAVARAAAHFPAPARAWHVAGGGRRNRSLVEGLACRLGVPVAPVEALGWRGDTLEAELMAYLAARSRRDLPITFPGTTGVPQPTGGGRLYPSRRSR